MKIEAKKITIKVFLIIIENIRTTKKEQNSLNNLMMK